jgi:tRNA (cmo5U34)-methyltransferase
MAAEYDEKITTTIPNYEFFHSETIDLVKTIHPLPEKWLDTGCGTGTLLLAAHPCFKHTKFTLADPSHEMLLIVKDKLCDHADWEVEVMDPVSSQGIKLPDGEFDVITAIQSHHYLDAEGRQAATGNCFRMLKNGGVYVTFENIKPISEMGVRLGLDRWMTFQISRGKSAEEALKHADRFGKEYFPITIENHLNLLRKVGFSCVEILWTSYMQAGFYAIKG